MLLKSAYEPIAVLKFPMVLERNDAIPKELLAFPVVIKYEDDKPKAELY